LQKANILGENGTKYWRCVRKKIFGASREGKSKVFGGGPLEKFNF
jgi:hypothetical protein